MRCSGSFRFRSLQSLFTRRCNVHRVDQPSYLEQPVEQRVRSHLNAEPAVPSVSCHLRLNENVQGHGIGKARRREIDDHDTVFVDELGKQGAELGGGRQIMLACEHDDGSVGLGMLHAQIGISHHVRLRSGLLSRE